MRYGKSMDGAGEISLLFCTYQKVLYASSFLMLICVSIMCYDIKECFVETLQEMLFIT